MSPLTFMNLQLNSDMQLHFPQPPLVLRRDRDVFVQHRTEPVDQPLPAQARSRVILKLADIRGAKTPVFSCSRALSLSPSHCLHAQVEDEDTLPA